MFNISDPIFTRQQRVDDSEFEEIEEWSRCGSCGDPSSQTFGKKLKNCHFCGQLTCPTDLNH